MKKEGYKILETGDRSGKNKQFSISAGGQHEVPLVLRSPDNPVRDALWQDVVNKNSTEPKVEMLLRTLGEKVVGP